MDAASRQLAAAAVGSVLGSAPALAGLSAIEALGPWRSLLLPLPTPLELLNRWGGRVDVRACVRVKGREHGWAGVEGEGAPPSCRVMRQHRMAPLHHCCVLSDTKRAPSQPAPSPRPASLPAAASRVAPALQPNEEDLAALATARGVADLVAQRSPAAALPPGPPSPSEAARLAQELGPLLPELLPGVARTGEMFTRALARRIAHRVGADVALPLAPGEGAGSAGPGEA